MTPEIVDGNILDQRVEAVVNAWNRNIIPWWLLLPQGVAGAIKRTAGTGPFRELGRHGPMPLGGAVLTSGGRSPFKGIIHVAAIDLLWRASARSVQGSVRSAMALVNSHGLTSVAFPVLGAGVGGIAPERAVELMSEAFLSIETAATVMIVRFGRRG